MIPSLHATPTPRVSLQSAMSQLQEANARVRSAIEAAPAAQAPRAAVAPATGFGNAAGPTDAAVAARVNPSLDPKSVAALARQAGQQLGAQPLPVANNRPQTVQMIVAEVGA